MNPDNELIRRGDVLDACRYDDAHDCRAAIDALPAVVNAIAALPAVVPSVKPLVEIAQDLGAALAAQRHEGECTL